MLQQSQTQVAQMKLPLETNGEQHNVLFLKKSPSNRGYQSVQISPEIRFALTNGLKSPSKMIQKLNFLMTRYPVDEAGTEWRFYPVKLLFRSEAERILNAVIRNETFPTEEQMNYMYTSIEDAVGQSISWYFDPSVFNITLEQMRAKYEGGLDVLDFNTQQEGLERVGELLCLRDSCISKTEAEWYHWYDLAWSVVKKVWEGIEDKRGIILEQDDLL